MADNKSNVKIGAAGVEVSGELTAFIDGSTQPESFPAFKCDVDPNDPSLVVASFGQQGVYSVTLKNGKFANVFIFKDPAFVPAQSVSKIEINRGTEEGHYYGEIEARFAHEDIPKSITGKFVVTENA
jgi:hypothetical protein